MSAALPCHSRVAARTMPVFWPPAEDRRVMMIQSVAGIVLLAIAALHVLWALGVWWPAASEAGLAHAVAGFRGANRMPGAAPAVVVAVLLTGAALWPWVGPALGRGLYRAGLVALALVFAGRGVAAWLPAWRRLTPVEPFATLDRRYFGPLCLLLGAGFALILMEAP